MKYINTFFNRFKKEGKYLPEDLLYTKISDSFGQRLDQESIDFFKTNKSIKPTDRELNYIRKFIEGSFKLRNFICKFYNGKNEIFICSLRFKSISVWYRVKCFEDDWYICEVNTSTSPSYIEYTDSIYTSSDYTSYWTFKCDSLDGICQLLLKNDYFSEKGIKNAEKKKKLRG